MPKVKNEEWRVPLNRDGAEIAVGLFCAPHRTGRRIYAGQSVVKSISNTGTPPIRVARTVYTTDSPACVKDYFARTIIVLSSSSGVHDGRSGV